VPLLTCWRPLHLLQSSSVVSFDDEAFESWHVRICSKFLNQNQVLTLRVELGDDLTNLHILVVLDLRTEE
jgi:hypothetical protein